MLLLWRGEGGMVEWGRQNVTPEWRRKGYTERREGREVVAGQGSETRRKLGKGACRRVSMQARLQRRPLAGALGRGEGSPSRERVHNAQQT